MVFTVYTVMLVLQCKWPPDPILLHKFDLIWSSEKQRWSRFFVWYCVYRVFIRYNDM